MCESGNGYDVRACVGCVGEDLEPYELHIGVFGEELPPICNGGLFSMAVTIVAVMERKHCEQHCKCYDNEAVSHDNDQYGISPVSQKRQEGLACRLLQMQHHLQLLLSSSIILLSTEYCILPALFGIDLIS